MENSDNFQVTSITQIKTHHLKKGRREEFEKELSRLSEIFSNLPGYCGANFFKSCDEKDSDYTVVLKFRSKKDYDNWNGSPEKRWWIQREKELTVSPPDFYTVSGLESWFTLPGNRILKPPRKYKQAAVTWLAVCILAVLTPLENTVFGSFPFIVQKMIDTAILVTLLSYALMPALTRVFSFWLYPDGSKKVFDKTEKLKREIKSL
ncbi:antibiotic biosynthesis monooxygenase (ABM) superfamily enzyme [Methanomicrobium sp. W14]|uniref:antibiotic biosynthesis monooxygenase n=1 Tax=Methanomicrobium sp. W14 TaxID=2817839 RepID=UPI001AE37A9B|nr:antibiotic biosynthesis monooxygenase [Methanomicrobium sp. W14]MBP2134480.1 antibiotic biosynthesis monooxygenase (ABM) superfamily enzyme [Methanomicrobium sp. W14]